MIYGLRDITYINDCSSSACRVGIGRVIQCIGIASRQFLVVLAPLRFFLNQRNTQFAELGGFFQKLVNILNRVLTQVYSIEAGQIYLTQFRYSVVSDVDVFYAR